MNNQHFQIKQPIQIDHHILTSTKIQSHKYDALFHFFLVKSINDICQKNHTPEYIVVKQYSYFDSDNEYLKRFYAEDEVEQRIQLLTELYCKEKALKLQNPRFHSSEMQQYLDKRKRRIKKIEKKLIEIQLQQLQSFESSFIKENISVASKNQQKKSLDEVNSLDSSVHDIFQSYEQNDVDYEQIASKYTKGTLDLFVETFTENQQNLNHLIVDFDDLDTQKVLKDYNKIKEKEQIAKKKKKQKLDSIISAKIKKQQIKKITKDAKKKFNQNFLNIEKYDKSLSSNTLRNQISTLSSYNLNNQISEANEKQQYQQYPERISRKINDLYGQEKNNLQKIDLLAQIEEKYTKLMNQRHTKQKLHLDQKYNFQQKKILNKSNKGIQFQNSKQYTQDADKDRQSFLKKEDIYFKLNSSNNGTKMLMLDEEYQIQIIKKRAKLLLGIQKINQIEVSQPDFNFFGKKKYDKQRY